MKTLIGLLIAILSVLAPLLLLATAVGMLLKWLLGLEWGFAVLTGVVSTGFAAHLVIYAMFNTTLEKMPGLAKLVDDDQDLDEDDELDEDFLSQVKIIPPRSWQHRRRKAKR